MLSGSALLFLVTTAAHAALPLEVKVDPANPQPGKAFRITALVKGAACEKITKITTNFPKAWMVVSEGKVKKENGCLVVEVVSAPAEGSEPWPGMSLQMSAGETAEGGAGSIVIGSPPGHAQAEAATSHEKELEAFLSQMQDFLALYLLGGQARQSALFSIESCREPVENFVKLFLKLTPSLKRQYKFKPGCDLEGATEMKLDTPVPFDLKVRNLGSVTRVKGIALVGAKQGSLTKAKIDSSVVEGEAYAGAGLLVKFSLAHTRTVALDMQTFGLNDIENEGTLKVSEFRGKAITLNRPFSDERFLARKKRR